MLRQPNNLRVVDSSLGLVEVSRAIAMERKAVLLEVKSALDRDDFSTAKTLMRELVNDEIKGDRTNPR